MEAKDVFRMFMVQYRFVTKSSSDDPEISGVCSVIDLRDALLASQRTRESKHRELLFLKYKEYFLMPEYQKHLDAIAILQASDRWRNPA